MSVVAPEQPPSWVLEPGMSRGRRGRNALATIWMVGSVILALVPLVFVFGYVVQQGLKIVNWQFLTEDIVDELQLTVAPVFVGDSEAPRFVRDGFFPWNPGRRAELVDVRKLGDVVLLRYALSARFEDA